MDDQPQGERDYVVFPLPLIQAESSRDLKAPSMLVRVDSYQPIDSDMAFSETPYQMPIELLYGLLVCSLAQSIQHMNCQKAWGHNSVVQLLPTIHKALNLIPTTGKQVTRTTSE